MQLSPVDLYPLFVLLSGVSILLIVIGFGEFLQVRSIQRVIRQRLLLFGNPDSQRSLKSRLTFYLEGQAGRSGLTQRILDMIASADLKWSFADLLGITLGLALVLGILLQLAFQLPLLLNSILSSIFATLLMTAFLKSKQNAYQRALQSQVPEIALLISNGLRANLSLTQSLKEITKKLPRPAAQEFQRVLDELEIVNSIDDALHNLLRRHPSDELYMLVTTLTTLRRSGGDMVEALATVSGAILARRRLRAEIDTITAESRFTSIAVVILPTVVLVILNQVSPGMVTRFMVNPLGLAFLLLVYVAPQIAAFFLIRRIGNVQV